MTKTEGNQEIAAAKAGMDAKTARKYRRLGRLPSELPAAPRWRTRPDPFVEVWEEVQRLLEINAGLEAKTIFEYLQRRQPGRFQDGQLRTLQRRIKVWRATEGPAKEVFFAQRHSPGRLGASDFTHMEELGVTIQGQSFPHLIYHFVLTYSNWETGTVCYSETFESLCEGLQNALWELGKVPHRHRTDRLSTAVNNTTNPAEFTERYQGLLRYYGLEGERTQAGHGNENGDVEQRHYRFKRATEQELLLRGSRDFRSVEDYGLFLRGLFDRLNAGRKKRLLEEMKGMKELPERRMESYKRERVKVDSGMVPENEYSMMKLAEAVGIDVAEVGLIPTNQIEGLPQELAEETANSLYVRRFDRTPEGGRIHIEDFNQVYHQFPNEKYKNYSYTNMAADISTFLGEKALVEFIRRLIFNAATGNADIHLKNWSVIYPDGRTPALAPGYDFVSTIQYIDDRSLALSIAKEKDTGKLDKELLEKFANKARIPKGIVIDTAFHTLETLLKA